MQPLHLIFNPASGSFSTARAEKIIDLLSNAGLTCHPYYPKDLLEVEQQIATICTQIATPTIIAIGGDGTVNTVVNSLSQGAGTLGIIPLGTANVMAQELGIRSLEDAIQRIVRYNLRPFSIGEATTTAGTRRFVLMAGIGCDAAAVADVRPDEKRLLGKGAYVLAGLRRCLDWDSRCITATCGERAIICNSLIVANAAHYAGPYRLVPQASLFDSQLVIAPLPFTGPLGLLRFTCSLFLTRSYKAPDAFGSQSKPISITGDKPVQLDGDTFGTAPLTIRLIPDFNNLII